MGCWRGFGGSLGSRSQRFEFLLDGGNIGINRLVEQTDLASIELLARAGELPAFECCQLMGEFVDLGLAVQDVAVFGGDDTGVLLALLCDLGNQLCSQCAQLFCVQAG